MKIEQIILDAFKNQGINEKKLIYAIKTDMSPNGEYLDTYMALDNQNIYILYGKERISKIKGNKRIKVDYEAIDKASFTIEKIGEYKNEILISTGRLIYENNQVNKAILMFSIGYLERVENFLKVLNNVRVGKPPFDDVYIDANTHCPKCNVKYSNQNTKVCVNCIDSKSVSIRLMRFFKDYKNKVVLILITMLAGSIFSIFSPMIGTRLFFDEVLTVGGKYYGAVLFFVLLFFMVRVIGLGLNILYSYVLAKTVPWIVQDLKVKIFEAMQRLSVGFFTSKQTGALMSRVNNDANNIYWFFVDGLPYVVVNLFTFTGIIIMMSILNIKLALICIIIIPFSILFFRMLWSVFKRYHHKFWVYGSRLNSMVSDSVNGQRVIKAFSKENEESQRFFGASSDHAKINIQSMNTEFTAFPLIYLFMFLGQAVITAYGGLMVVRGELTLGTLLTFIAYLSMLYGPLEFMSWVSNWWARCVDSAQRVFEVVDAKPDISEPENPYNATHIKGDIKLTNVKFEYEPATLILKGLTLDIKSGEMLGIVGKTGAGKSTLANLIARLYDVTSGTIEIDGVNVKEYPLALLRKNIGIVSQDIYLFIGTIADNIRYARPNASMDDVIRAAKASFAHDFIMQLPDGYETKVGAGGKDLSGGEKQRLSIARTILQNPKILILDEATASMDTKTEVNIQNALDKLQKQRTTIAIAHRLSTLKNADKLAVIEDGKVIEYGTFTELIEKKGHYHKLYLIQQEGLKIIQMDA